MQSSTTELFTQHKTTVHITQVGKLTHIEAHIVLLVIGKEQVFRLSPLTCFRPTEFDDIQLTAGGGGLGTKWLNGVSVEFIIRFQWKN